MMSPISSLAFTMQANKGVFALLLGSGISRAAGIPTGWEITIELVRKVAALQGENCEPDPAAWFFEKTDKQPDYSDLLDMVAQTAAERQQLLRHYWEPTEQEREEGLKKPTQAHRAIADLMKLGYIRVVLTTNFDRLLETALHDVGIQPTVLSSVDHIDGAMPIIHTECTIIKVHGDYLDTRIKNTPNELATYPAAVNKLLDRIHDEFGFVIAGWSGEWDLALRESFTRAPNRRFSTFWTSRGEPSARAKNLIDHRRATVVRIEDADSFFVSLCEQIKSLEDFSRPHPISTEVAIITLKKYLSENKYRIALDDFISREVEGVIQAVNSGAFDASSKDLSSEAVLNRLLKYEAAAATLVKMAFVAGQWSEGDQVTPWVKALAKLSHQRTEGGVVLWLNLQRYPAALLLYSFSLGAIAKNQWSTLRTVFDTPLVRDHRGVKRAVDLISIWNLFDNNGQAMRILPKRDREHTPLNNHVEALLYEAFGSKFSSHEDFTLTFDRLEILIALSYGSRIKNGDRYWSVPGAYGWRINNKEIIFNELRENLAQNGSNSTFIINLLIGNTLASASKNIADLDDFINRLGFW